MAIGNKCRSANKLETGYIFYSTQTFIIISSFADTSVTIHIYIYISVSKTNLTFILNGGNIYLNDVVAKRFAIKKRIELLSMPDDIG